MTEPYWQDEQVTLYHGDCLEIAEWLSADVLVTDPPYGIGWKQGDYNGVERRIKRNTDRCNSGIQRDIDTTTRDLALSKWGVARVSVVFGSFRAAPPSNVVQTLVWKKGTDTGVVGSVTGYRTDIECIFLRGPHIRRPAARSSVLESLCGRERYAAGHPHSKPVPVLEQLIAWLPDGVLADPFAGSGSTLVAARNLGRRCIGVELEERYCEIIATRLAQGALDFGEAS